MNLGIGDEEELRESERRKNTLEKFAQLRSREPDSRLSIEDTPTAFVEVEEDVEKFLNVTITNRKFEQKHTSLPEEYHDYILQRGFTAHEVGHILYSSYPQLEKFSEMVIRDEMDTEGMSEGEAEEYKELFHAFFNVLEDGAIEKFLGENFRLEEELHHLRATIHEDHYVGSEKEFEHGTEYYYPMFHAIMTAALNIGVYDNGELDKLLDENNDKHIFGKRGREKDRQMFVDDCLPLLRQEIPKIQSEANARDRTEKIYELWKEIRRFLTRSTTEGKVDYQNSKFHMESDSYMENVPENLSPSHGNQGEEPIGTDSEDGDGEMYLGEVRAEKTAEGQESSIEDKAERGLMSEAVDDGNDWSEELEEIINALGAGDGIEEIMVADDGEVDHARMEEAKRLSKRTSRLFARRLRHMKKDRMIQNKERGIFNSRALIPAERGSTRCFEQKKEGNDKNYRCMIVLDRSGSMSDNIQDVELAAGAIAWGLEDNGVDTCILDTESSQTTLSKPFGVDINSFKEKIFAGRCSGGTPITGTMKFARQRMSRGEGDLPFVIVITDGEPYKKEKFKSEVRKMNFPVLGLYLTNKESGLEEQLSLYDKSIVCNSEDDINQQLINLINKIIF